ncbi:class I cytochrome c [Terriglobus saanensis]|uniref:Cytochrome c, class I n=1 Tax=Terriglobus saanensis (strain ATCC BAA-1853 / DSM 23119 / SP1PR4) TaxID=401053 RepID=E8UYX5_TERSS|nr:class I cytochrome c [Terriglobus saanensis]ADV84341.1 cytochrome c, class I [Terriglobus saanensis SP1PR4]
MAGLLSFAAVSPDTKKVGIQELPPFHDKLPLHESRIASEDLTVSGDLPGLPAKAVRFVSYPDLLRLPQVNFKVTDDPNFKEATEIGGVYLEEVLRALGISEEGTLIAAICDDKYEAHYPVAYRAAHHPILVLQINGKPLSQRSRTGDGGTYGPYLISHASFTPRFRVLSYAEEAQIPNGVLELRFSKEHEVFEAIHPRGPSAGGSSQRLGYTIARENCFRCHNSGDYGGNKSGRPWSSLARLAQTNPEDFARYIKDPHSVNRFAQMPGFPEYDEVTLSALTAYFQTFASGSSSQ